MVFAVHASRLLERADVGYAAGTVRFEKAYSDPRYPLVKLGELASQIQYGSSARADATSEDGVPMLRMVNVRDDRFDFGAMKYVRMSEVEQQRYPLEKGDLLFNRTNSKELVGKCAVFDAIGDYVFASYLIRVQLDLAIVRPRFVATFLATSAGRIQIDRVSRQIIGMANVNAQELRELVIPLPSLEEQDRLLAPVLTAAEEVSADRLQAERLVAEAGSRLQVRLGLAQLEHSLPRSFAVRTGDLVDDLRFDAKAYRGRAVPKTERMEAVPLAAASEINPRAQAPRASESGDVPFVGLPDCDGTRVTRVGRRPAGEVKTAPLAQASDVLFARIEPSIFNKKYVFVDESVLPAPFYTSTEFYVLRAREGVILPGYLWAILFTDYFSRQIEGQTTGSSGRRRLPVDSLAAISIPLPAREVQAQLSDEFLRERGQAQRLVERATSTWRTVKADFAAAVLGAGARE